MLTFFATMGLELLAEEVEEPFGGDSNDLPLDDIAGWIKERADREPPLRAEASEQAAPNRP